MTTPRYATPQAFKQALEQRLRSASASGIDLARRRQILVFERFLARVHHEAGDAVVLKGGLVLELRLARARTTKDVDLRMMGTPAQLLERLQAAGRVDLQDFMRFEVQRDRHHPDIQGEGMKYAGHRFATECRLAGKIYGRPFGVDVGFGDPLVGEPDEVVGDDTLAFTGTEPTRLRLYPVVSHIAEKLHAFHDAALPTQFADQGPARHRAAGERRSDRCGDASFGTRQDVRVSGDTCVAGSRAAAAGNLERALRSNGHVRRTALADTRRAAPSR